MNVDLEKAKKEFLNYIGNYDINDNNIERKKLHSLRVMEISKKIAENLKLSQEEIEIATLIGLLHDIARFEQYKKYHTYNDLESIDHGDFGFLILERDLKKYIETDKYDNIIKLAIKNHNKFKISEDLTDKEILFSKIIRDADKIDILYEAIEWFWVGEEKNIEESKITKEIVEEFRNSSTVKNRKDSETNVEVYKIIRILSFVFDINFKISFQILKQEDYINKILNRFDFKNEDTKVVIEEIRNKVNGYIEENYNK